MYCIGIVKLDRKQKIGGRGKHRKKHVGECWSALGSMFEKDSVHLVGEYLVYWALCSVASVGARCSPNLSY